MNETDVKQNKSGLKAAGSMIGCLLMILLFVVIQVIISTIACMVVSVQCAMEYMDASEEVIMDVYMKRVQNPDFLTNVTCFATIATTVVALLWYKLGYVKNYTKEKMQQIKIKLCNKNTIFILILTAVVFYFLAILLTVGIEILSPSTIETYNEMIESSLGGEGIVVILATVILAPIGEECLMRGVIYHKLEKHFSVKIAIILQAVFFSIYHLNIVQGLYVFPFALMLGYIVYRYKSIIPCIFVHAIHNGMNYIVQLLPAAFINLITVLIIVIVGGYLLIRLWKKEEDVQNPV